MNREITSSSAEDTFAAGRELAMHLNSGDVVALRGELGAGKTVFVKGIASALGINDDITSPTFSLMEAYDADVSLYHFDLYRIEDIDEFQQLRFEEYWEGDGISVIEWPERCGRLLPKRRIDVMIDYIDENRRKITIEYTGY